MLAMKMSQVSGDMSLSSSEKLNKLIDELNHEAGEPVFCIYVAVGQKGSTIASLVQTLLHFAITLRLPGRQ